MEQRYERMYPDGFHKAVGDLPVFFVPAGLLEWHGDHLPLGTDAEKAHGICLEAARRLGGGIVLPPLYIGRPGYSRRIGTLTFSAPCVELVLTELLEQLAKVGAKVVVILSGHYGDCQVDCVKRTAREFEVEHPEVRILALPEYEDVLVDGERPADHAKRWETSLMKAVSPGSVRLEAYRTGEQPIEVYADVPNDYYKEDARWSPQIDLASLDLDALGRKALDAIADHLVDRVRSLLP